MMAKAPFTFSEIVNAAINDLMIHGYDSADRVGIWVARIREAAQREAVPDRIVQAQLAKTLRGIYNVQIESGRLLRYHPGVERFTIERIKPKLRAELDRSIMAAADLIKLNREEAIHDTIQRFSGWATSIPPGGTKVQDRRDTSKDIRKAMQSLPFRERRVAIDQGHKFTANLSSILAKDGGAIAGIWHSNWRQANYNYRKDHKERDEKVYVVRANWAMEKGLMKLDGHQYTDQITACGEEVYCRCHYQWIYTPRALPPDMLTDKGKQALAAARAQLQAMRAA